MSLQEDLENLPTFNLIDNWRGNPNYEGIMKTLVFRLGSGKLFLRHGDPFGPHVCIVHYNLRTELAALGITDRTLEDAAGGHDERVVHKGVEKAVIEIIGGGQVKLNVPEKSYIFRPRSLQFRGVVKECFDELIRQYRNENPQSSWKFDYENEWG